MYAVLEYDKRAHVRRVREVYKLLPNISQHNRFGTACADGQMKNALNDSGEQTKQRALARHVEQTLTTDERHARYKRSTSLVDVECPPVDFAFGLLVQAQVAVDMVRQAHG